MRSGTSGSLQTRRTSPVRPTKRTLTSTRGRQHTRWATRPRTSPKRSRRRLTERKRARPRAGGPGLAHNPSRGRAAMNRRLSQWDDAVRDASIVLGVDRQERDVDGSGTVHYGSPGSAAEDAKTIFFGQSLLALIRDGYEGTGLQCRIVHVPIDWNTD